MQNPDSNEGSSFVTLAIILFTVFMVAAVTFSAYLIIDVTRVSNLSNIHVTKNLLMAANNAKGDLYSDPQKGIKDWIIYADRPNGFEIRYPSEYKLEKGNGEGQVIALKRSNLTPQGIDSLSSIIYVNINQSGDGTSLKDEAEKMGISWQDNWTQQEIGGRPGIRTGEITDSSGSKKDVILWQFGGKIFSLQEYHFNENALKDDENFEKIVSEFRFL